MVYRMITFVVLAVCSTTAQLILTEPIVYALQPSRQSVAHPTVLENSIAESHLPKELIKSNDQYNNPHIAAALAKESLPTSKEMIIFDRETEKIPRDRILKIFRNAGWA